MCTTASPGLLQSLGPALDRTSIKCLILVTFRTCSGEISLRAHFTWTQNNYADPYPYDGECHSLLSPRCVLSLIEKHCDMSDHKYDKPPSGRPLWK